MIVPIGKFDGGVITNADPEDISNDACINMLNLRTDVSGKLVKQKGHSVVQSLSVLNSGNPFVIDRIIQWTHPKLTNGYGWIFYEKTAKKIWFADYNYTNILLLKTFTGTQPDNVRLEQVGEEIRIAMGLLEKSQVIQFLKDRKFFNGQFNPYSSANSDDDYVFIDNQEPSYPTTWNYQGEIIADTSSSLGNKIYYYKAVPVFDGTQEYKFKDNDAPLIVDLTGQTEKSIKAKFIIDSDDMNKRMTGINIYRASASSGTDAKPYYKISSVTVNTLSDQEQSITGVAPCLNRFYLHGNPIQNTTVFNDRMDNFKTGFASGGSTAVATNPFIEILNPDGTVDYSLYIFEGTEGNSDYVRTETINGVATQYLTVSGSFTSTHGSNSTTFTNSSSDLQKNRVACSYKIKYRYHNSPINGNVLVHYGLTPTNQTDSVAYFNNNLTIQADGFTGDKVLYRPNTFTTREFYNGFILKQGTSTFSITKSSIHGLELSHDFGSSDSLLDVIISLNDYYITYNSSTGVAEILIQDNGMIDQSPHPITEDKLSLNHIVAEDVGARRFFGHVRLDPDSDFEDHSNFLVYSDLNQPDIHPISNYIQIKDKQGGGIIALKKIGDSLAVFMENGLYQLYIPSNDPKMWSLVESEENIGCIAPYSVVRTKTSIFFASANNIYELNGNWQLIPIGEPIKDIWQGFTESQKKATTFTYNSKRNTLSCVFALVGGAVANSGIWEYSLDTRTWSKFNNSFTGTNTGKFTFIDKDENVLCYVSNSDNSETSIVKLDSSSSSETLQTTRTTGWINFSSLSNAYNVQLRRFSMSYDSGDTVTVEFYKDGDASTSVFSNNTTFTSTKKQAEIKVPIRCNQIMIKTSTPSSVNDVSINRMEIETDA